MTVKQVRMFYEGKNDVKCQLTEELITSGYRQTKHRPPDNDYIAYYESINNCSPDYRKAEPSQWWHLIRSYCDFKQPDDIFHPAIRCGELLFWMAEILVKEGLLDLREVDLIKIKDEALRIARENSPKPFPNPDKPLQPLRTVEANKYIRRELFSKIVKAIEKYYIETQNKEQEYERF